MVKKREDFPREGELIIGTVKNVNPYSAFIELDEYGKEGMIHISEIAKKWINDIRSWVKKGDKIVCMVLDVDEHKGHIKLSLKRVSPERKRRRLQKWKRDQKGEKFLSMLAKESKLSLDQAYKKIGFDLQNKFKDLLEPFELAVKDKKKLEKRDISEKWVKNIGKIASQNLKIKKVKLTKNLNLRINKPDGVKTLRRVLTDIKKKHPVNVAYISAPKYELSIDTKDPKMGEKILEKAGDEVISNIKKYGGEGFKNESG